MEPERDHRHDEPDTSAVDRVWRRLVPAIQLSRSTGANARTHRRTNSQTLS